MLTLNRFACSGYSRRSTCHPYLDRSELAALTGGYMQGRCRGSNRAPRSSIHGEFARCR